MKRQRNAMEVLRLHCESEWKEAKAVPMGRVVVIKNGKMRAGRGRNGSIRLHYNDRKNR